MPTIVDTYNVLHVEGVLPPELAGPDITGLARLTADSRFAGEPVVLVCDGSPPGVKERPVSVGPVQIRFAGRGRSADDEIIRLVEQSSTPRRLTIVSSDRAIQRAARRRR